MRRRVFFGLALYAGILGFCVGVYAFYAWLYLAHPVWFAAAIVGFLAVVAALVWDDLGWQDT